jgi:hypothetical protein
MGELSRGGVSPALVEVEAGATIGTCEGVVEELVTIAVCESVDERTVGVSRRHPPVGAMGTNRVRNLKEIFKRIASA